MISRRGEGKTKDGLVMQKGRELLELRMGTGQAGKRGHAAVGEGVQ